MITEGMGRDRGEFLGPRIWGEVIAWGLKSHKKKGVNIKRQKEKSPKRKSLGSIRSRG